MQQMQHVIETQVQVCVPPVSVPGLVGVCPQLVACPAASSMLTYVNPCAAALECRQLESPALMLPRD